MNSRTYQNVRITTRKLNWCVHGSLSSAESKVSQFTARTYSERSQKSIHAKYWRSFAQTNCLMSYLQTRTLGGPSIRQQLRSDVNFRDTCAYRRCSTDAHACDNHFGTSSINMQPLQFTLHDILQIVFARDFIKEKTLNYNIIIEM